MFICNDCKGKKYVVYDATGNDNLIVERCDACCQGTPYNMTDAEAAQLAIDDGYELTLTFPFTVLATPEETKQMAVEAADKAERRK